MTEADRLFKSRLNFGFSSSAFEPGAGFTECRQTVLAAIESISFAYRLRLDYIKCDKRGRLN